MSAMQRDWLKPHEVAELEDVHVATVWRWIKIGALPASRSPGGRTLRIPRNYREQLGSGDARAQSAR